MDKRYAVLRLKGVIDFLNVFLQDHKDMGNHEAVKDYEEDIEALKFAIEILTCREKD